MGITAVRSADGTGLEIRLGERFDFSQHRDFRAAYADLDVAHMSVRVDLKDTQFMDSSALGMLLVLRERAGGDRADITLCGTSPAICQVLAVSRFEQLFKVQ